MTDLLDRAVASVGALPPEAQDDIARMLLQWTGEDDSVVMLPPEEEASLTESRAQADRGEFATEAEVQAVWAKHSS